MRITIISLVATANVLAVYGGHLTSYNHEAMYNVFPSTSYNSGFMTNQFVAMQANQASPPNVHEIHTGGGQRHVRVEEYRQPAQVVRIHEAPPSPPQVLRVQAPPPAPSVVRLIQRPSGPTHIERVVFQPPHAQVVNVQRPPRAPERIVQIERGPATQPRIVYHGEQPTVVTPVTVDQRNVFTSSSSAQLVG